MVPVAGVQNVAAIVPVLFFGYVGSGQAGVGALVEPWRMMLMLPDAALVG